MFQNLASFLPEAAALNHMLSGLALILSSLPFSPSYPSHLSCLSSTLVSHTPFLIFCFLACFVVVVVVVVVGVVVVVVVVVVLLLICIFVHLSLGFVFLFFVFRSLPVYL